MLRRTLLVVCIFTSLAAKTKSPSLPPGDMFFTMKGQPAALERIFPGVTAALMLSDDQKNALNEAYHETVAAPVLREKGLALRGNKGTSDADRDAVKSEMEGARIELQKRVSMILTPDQKELIPKIQAAAEQARRAASESLSAEFAVAKGDPQKAIELRKRMQV